MLKFGRHLIAQGVLLDLNPFQGWRKQVWNIDSSVKIVNSSNSGELKRRVEIWDGQWQDTCLSCTTSTVLKSILYWKREDMATSRNLLHYLQPNERIVRTNWAWIAKASEAIQLYCPDYNHGRWKPKKREIKIAQRMYSPRMHAWSTALSPKEHWKHQNEQLAILHHRRGWSNARYGIWVGDELMPRHD